MFSRCPIRKVAGPRPKQTKVYVGRTSSMTSYVAYYRVSTARQGRSGLGLAAQKTKVEGFLQAQDSIAAEFVEVESGKSDDRTELWKAVACAKKHGAPLLIAKLDRFSRRVSFIASVMERGVRLVVADMPNATDFQLHIFAALAQEERRLISERTRNALAEAKRRGVQLGKHGRVLAAENNRKANLAAEELAPIVRPLLQTRTSYSEIARRLNEQGVTSARGSRFYPETVRNLAKRMSLEVLV